MPPPNGQPPPPAKPPQLPPPTHLSLEQGLARCTSQHRQQQLLLKLLHPPQLSLPLLLPLPACGPSRQLWRHHRRLQGKETCPLLLQVCVCVFTDPSRVTTLHGAPRAAQSKPE
jgi:hypothetical protein